jgi:hypothetical protein
MKPIDVSIQIPQLEPPPPSGESNMPAAGIVLSPQEDLRRGQLLSFSLSAFHMVMFS